MALNAIPLAYLQTQCKRAFPVGANVEEPAGAGASLPPLKRRRAGEEPHFRVSIHEFRFLVVA